MFFAPAADAEGALNMAHKACEELQASDTSLYLAKTQMRNRAVLAAMVA